MQLLFNFCFLHLLLGHGFAFVGLSWDVHVIYMYSLQAVGRFGMNSKSGGINRSFRGVEGWEWLQKRRNS